MPATQGYRLDEWHEGPFLGASHDILAVPDDRVFDINDPVDVAQGLLETSAEIEAYEWLVDKVTLQEMAMESAKMIIAARDELLIDRNLESEFRSAQNQRNERGLGHLAVVACSRQDLNTGEVSYSASTVPRSRISA